MRGEDATWPRALRERPAANVNAVSHYSQDASRRQRDSGHDGGKEHLPRLLLPPPNPKKQQLRQDSPWDKTFSPPPEIQRGGDREDWRARLRGCGDALGARVSAQPLGRIPTPRGPRPPLGPRLPGARWGLPGAAPHRTRQSRPLPRARGPRRAQTPSPSGPAQESPKG